MAALDCLKGTYTDSEGEEELFEEDRKQSTVSNSNNDSQKHASPSKPKSANESGNKVLSRLVSYGHDDVVMSDDENDAAFEEPSQTLIDELRINIADTDGVQLPPEPPGRCSKELQDKFIKNLNSMKTRKINMNELIQSRKDFRNPSIYEKLVQFCGINELGTNYPPSFYDPSKWEKDSFYDEYLKALDVERRRRVKKQEEAEKEKKAKKKAKVEFVSGTAKRPAATIISGDETKMKKLL